MADAKEDKTVEDDQKEVSGVAPTLDEVHAMNQAKVEAEDGDESAKDKDDGEGAESAEDEDAKDDEDVVEESEKPEVKEPVKPEPPAEATDEPDLDITKNVKGKVAIKNTEGKVFYFNNLDEVPDDFEPASYKALMTGTTALLQKKQHDEAAAKDAETKVQTDANAAATKAMQEDWEKDAADLTSVGFLPKGDKNEAAKTEVYNYIESEMKKGNIITSFKQAYKNMMFDKQQEVDKEKQKELDDAKKKRGSIVQGGGGSDAGTTNNRGGRVFEAPPTGVGLDAVHARALNSL